MTKECLLLILLLVRLKSILLKTVTKVPGKMVLPVDDEAQAKAEETDKKISPSRVTYKKLCRTGGIVNVYKAVIAAEAMKEGK